MALPCVAERSETFAELTMLRDLGCSYGQGFGLARPMGADAAALLAHSGSQRFGEAAGRAAA